MRPRQQEVKLKEGTFPAGSFVIKRDQPYGRLSGILLEKQDFPDPRPYYLRRALPEYTDMMSQAESDPERGSRGAQRRYDSR